MQWLFRLLKPTTRLEYACFLILCATIIVLGWGLYRYFHQAKTVDFFLMFGGTGITLVGYIILKHSDAINDTIEEWVNGPKRLL